MPLPSGEEPLLVTVMRPYDRDTLNFPGVSTLHPPRKMRAVLEVITPEVHKGDHETTVEVLHTGSYGSLAVELVRLFIYLETNDLAVWFADITGCKVDMSKSANVVDFLRCLGFLTKTNINWLRSSTDPTSQVFLRRLLYHAIFDGTNLDILRLLMPGQFDVNESVHVPDFYTLPKVQKKNLLADQKDLRTERVRGLDSYPQTLLQCFCLIGDINAVHLLLDLGADPYDTGGRPREFSPLECAASFEHHDRANIIAGLILSKQTRCSSEFQKESIEIALRLAISESNTELIVKLISERKRLYHETIFPRHLIIAAEYGDSDTVRLLVEYAPRGEDGLLMLPEDILFTAIRSCHIDENAMSEMLKKIDYLLELGADPTVLKNSHDIFQSFILCHLHSMRQRMFPDDDYSDRENCALELAATLRKHGWPPRRSRSTFEGQNLPSALQAAISLGYSRLVEHLLDWGVDIDFCIDRLQPVTEKCETCFSYTGEYNYVDGRSPLLTALESLQTGMAKMLLKRKPNLTLHGGEKNLAMKSGDDPELVTMLLRADSANPDGWEDFLEQAVLRRNTKSIELLLSIGTYSHGPVGPTTILRAALARGDHDEAYKQIAVCGYDSQALFDTALLSHRGRDYHKFVERLLEMRPNTLNDGFEVRAIAYAALYHDMYLLGVLMKSLGQGPWVAQFPESLQQFDQNGLLPSWVPDDNDPGLSKHILEYVAEHNAQFKTGPVIKTLLEAGVSATGIEVRTEYELAAETWQQLIAAGADLGAAQLLADAVEGNLLAHVEVLCESKVPLDRMGIEISSSRTPVQLAVERGSPEMLQMLLRYGVDVDGPAGFYLGATCLQVAVGSGNIGLVRFLLDKGAKVNARRSLFEGRTAIEIAAEYGRLDVLKLLLLQEQHLFRSAAERHQFIRAAKFAETRGHTFIVQILKQHIDWDSYDQQLFDAIRYVSSSLHLDDMTQDVLESEKRDPQYWNNLAVICESVEVDDIYDIDGIEKWIGEPHEWIPDSDLSSDGKSDHTLDINSLDTGRHQDEIKDGTVRNSETRNQIQSNLNQPAQVMSMDDRIHDAMKYPESMHGCPIDEQSARRPEALSLNPEWAGKSTAIAPQVIRCEDNVPAWLNDPAAQEKVLGVLQNRSAKQNVSREPGMVFGEVLDGMPHIDETGDDAVDHSMVEDLNEGEQIQHFDWGFWDDQGIGWGLAD